jgi:putative ABC transport system permease protein
MRTRSRLERLLRSRILGPSVDRQIEEELDLHVEMVARELMAAGMEESAARAAAAERFRGRAAVAAACGRIARGAERRLRLAVQLEELRQDVAYGMRQLARSPGFTAVALLTLAVGLGAATAIFSVVEGVVLRRFPFAHPERLTVRVSLPEAVYPRPAEVERAFGEMVERLAHAPGVRAAAAASAAPLGAGGASNGLLPEGKPMASENLIDSTLHIVTPGYFETLRLPLLAGRSFSARDTRSAGRVMIISRELARRAWGDADPIGKRIGCCELGPGAATVKTVVGLVGDVRSRGPAEPPAPEFYLPIGQAPPDGWNWTQRTMTLVARGPDPRLLANAMRGAVRGVDAALPLSQVRSMDEALQGSLAEARFHTLLLLVLGLLGLLLAAVGIYGVIAYFVGSRTQEIGVRIALGATRERILSLLGRQAAAPLAGGLLLGTRGALAATRLLAGSLHGVTATDPATFTCVVLLLVAVGLLAVLIPAARATRVDPTRAIQEP